MEKCKFLLGLLGLVYLSSIGFELIDNNLYSNYSEALILPLVTIMYFIKIKQRSLFLVLFLVLYSISDLFVLVSKYIPYEVDYYGGNGLYILAYLFLLVKILKTINFKEILKNYNIHLLVLLLLSVYIVYVLQIIIQPYLLSTNEYLVELIYNIILLLLLSASLLNYFYRDNVKSLYLFLAVLTIVFAEVIWIAYSYISQRNILNILSTTLHIISYYFIFQQAKLVDEKKLEVEIAYETNC